jgi:hypothetical protein
MTETWDEARLQQYILDDVEESLNLEYKSSGSLGKNNDKTREITKDVSSMANSDGGIIIYGIAEYREEDKKHKPENLSPINRTEYSKEWIQQIINTIRPKIDGLVIYAVALSSGTNDVAYVIEIPQSHTAHQATDKRYYKRFNFLSEAMDDYEVRDVMGRGQHPKIELEFKIKRKRRSNLLLQGLDPQHEIVEDMWVLSVNAINKGKVLAQYVYCTLYLPAIFLTNEEHKHNTIKFERDSSERAFYTVTFNNGEAVDIENNILVSEVFKPILPQLSLLIGEQEIGINYLHLTPFDTSYIKWEAYADNAPPNIGTTLVKSIQIES